MQRQDDLIRMVTSEMDIRPENISALESRFLELREHSIEEFKHSLRVERYAVAISRAFGNYNYLTNMIIGLSGRYHDLGKMAIPKNILKKRFLREDDLKVIREHPITGYELIIRHAPELEMVAQIVVQHHLWQEDSYPKRLPNLPYFAFTKKLSYILSVADSVDARLTRTDNQSLHQGALKEYLMDNKPLVKEKVNEIIDIAISKRRTNFEYGREHLSEHKPINHLVLAEILEEEDFPI